MSEATATIVRRGGTLAKKNGKNGGTDHDLLLRILDRLDGLEQRIDEVETNIRRDLKSFRQAWASGHLDHEVRLQRIEKRLRFR